MQIAIISFKRKASFLQYFSLIEVLVALTIISVCFVIMFHSLTNDINNTAVINGYTTAAMLSKKKMAEIMLNEEKIRAGKTEGDFGDKYPLYKWNLEIKKEEKNLYYIKLTVEFTTQGKTRNVIDSTCVYKTEKSKNDKTKTSNTTNKTSQDSLTDPEDSTL